MDEENPIAKFRGAWGYDVDSVEFVRELRGYRHTVEMLPCFLREEVKKDLIDFEQKTEQHLSEREMAIFSFGFEYGQRNILREQRTREIRAKRSVHMHKGVE